jgi:hypothetical protein
MPQRQQCSESGLTVWAFNKRCDGIMKHSISKELIWSAICAGIGLAFLYRAAFGVDRSVVHVVLWYVGCGFGSIALAIQPSALFQSVERKGLRFRLPSAHGAASLINTLSMGCIVFSGIAWVATLW